MSNGANFQQVREIVETAVRKRVDDYGIKIEVTPGRDHDGDEALFVEVFYDLTEQPVDPRTLSRALHGLTTEIREALEAVGETRFPYVRNRFDEHQKVAAV